MSTRRARGIVRRIAGSSSRTRCVRAAIIVLGVYAAACAERRGQPPPGAPSPPVAAAPSPTPSTRRFTATAYSQEGRTASGRQARVGIVAADPKVLPIGTRIRISNAGQYSGEYTVADTGRAIKGHDIDIYIASDAAAKRFGRRTVNVEVLGRGGGGDGGKAAR